MLAATLNTFSNTTLNQNNSVIQLTGLLVKRLLVKSPLGECDQNSIARAFSKGN
jgi:hypothetical protein